jgi:altronate dehydratase large subunit
MRFHGYRRADGSVGVRNHVVAVSTVLCSSEVTRDIARATGAMAITHEGGCGELGAEKEHTERMLRGVLRHPNVGAALIVGLGCEQIEPERLAKAAAMADKPIRFLSIQECGGPSASVGLGAEMVRAMRAEIAGADRQPASLADMVLATQCGGSDTGSGLASNPGLGATSDLIIANGGTVILGETGGLYGAAGFLTRRAATPEVAKRILEITDAIERHSQRLGKSIKEANPTPGNIAGGLTTLVEKALGGVRKAGTSLIQGVVQPGERVTGKGLWVMDTSVGIGACAMSDMLVGGAQILAYTTGRGNPLGSPLGPVIKITATAETARSLHEIIDFDASPVLRGEETIQECGKRLLDEMLAVAGGKLTKSEQVGHYAFAIGKIAR